MNNYLYISTWTFFFFLCLLSTTFELSQLIVVMQKLCPYTLPNTGLLKKFTTDVKLHKGEILHNQLKKKSNSTYTFIVQNAFLFANIHK